MKRLFISFLTLLIAISSAMAQQPTRISIRGVVVDTIGQTLPGATIMLLNPKDSTLINFAHGADDGGFELKNIKNQPYLLKISYVSFLPFQKQLPVSALPIMDLGQLAIKPIPSELVEVVIRDARAALVIRGDTIEYDAASFKAPPGSTVEDLLRRLPGIEVDASGNIRAQGQDVQRVYVDGKTFFSNDPKAATKNLGAEALSKIQVYDDKSEQAKITGIDDGKKEKAMNLELKEAFKNGRFGKATLAGGTEDRWAARGNLNRFNKKEQFSVIGYANNINQTGVNWEDYSEFKGQASQNEWEDNGDFGFDQGGMYRTLYIDNDDVRNNFDGRGFTENAGAGTNYNFDNAKSKLNASYFFNQTDLSLDQFGFRQTFSKGLSFVNLDTLARSELRRNHRVESRFQQKIDSFTTVVAKVSARASEQSSQEELSQLFSKADEANSRLSNNNDKAMKSGYLTSTFIARRHFHRKKGRTAAISGGFNGRKSDGDESLSSTYVFFQTADQPSRRWLLNALGTTVGEAKASALFVEPFSKNWFLESFYNFRDLSNRLSKAATDRLTSGAAVDSLSFFQKYDVRSNRIGTTARYAKNGANLAFGLAYLSLSLEGSYARAEGEPLADAPISKSFKNLVPSVQANYEFSGRRNLNFSYARSIVAPSLENLQPVPDYSNPSFLSIGNPDLDAERSHDFSLRFNKWSAGRLSSFSASASASVFENQIAFDQTVEQLSNGAFRTLSRPMNRPGGWRVWSNVWTNFPLVKTKLTASFNANFSLNSRVSAVNGEENQTLNYSERASASLNFTPFPKAVFSLSASAAPAQIRYSLQTSLDQDIWQSTIEASAKWQFLPKTFFESNFARTAYRNDRFAFDQVLPIWNASVRQLLGKNNRFEARLAAFDVFNKTVWIRQSGAQNSAQRTVAPTLARYFMLSMSYNIKGYEAKLGRQGRGGGMMFF